MKVERVEHVALNPYESKLVIKFAELMYDIEREVTDERIKSIIADIRHNIDTLDEFLWEA